MAICIIDYGTGNIKSVVNMLRRLDCAADVSSDVTTVKAAEKLILPGVGAFDQGMKRLQETGIAEVVKHKVLRENTPLLGICLGAQLLLASSEEGRGEGLRLVGGKVVRFQPSSGSMKVPHMGWNNVAVRKKNPLFKGLEEEARFYFVHSYHFSMEDDEDVIGTTEYGYPFVSAFRRRNVYGVQFHPEKSHKFGMTLLRNFAELPV